MNLFLDVNRTCYETEQKTWNNKIQKTLSQSFQGSVHEKKREMHELWKSRNNELKTHVWERTLGIFLIHDLKGSSFTWQNLPSIWERIVV